MVEVTRRQTLALGAGAFLTDLLAAERRSARPAGHAHHRLQRQPAVVRSDDGPSAVNPTIQAIYRSIFDQYIGQKPDLAFEARPADRMGLERRQDEALDGRARGRQLARRLAVHARGRRLVARARRRRKTAATRSRSSGRPSATSRSTATGSPRDVDAASSRPSSSGWRSSPAMSCPRPITRRSARKASRRSRSAPAPIWSTNIEGNAFLRLKANPNYWGGKPAFETVIFKFVPDATSRVAEIEVRLLRRHARSAVRGVRPPEEGQGPARAWRRRSPTSA